MATKPFARTSFRTRTRRHETLKLVGSVLVIAVAITAVIAGFVLGNDGNRGSAAKDAALEDGFSEVTDVDRKHFKVWGGCRKNYFYYAVTGVRDGDTDTIGVCVSTFNTYVK